MRTGQARRPGAADANNLIEQALVHPLQEGPNYVTMGAAFLALIPGLEPLMVVAGAASLANAGISALEGSYMSAGMYAVTGVIPFAGRIADIGEMADGAAAGLSEATPAAEAVVSDAGQVESQVLAADGVESRLFSEGELNQRYILPAPGLSTAAKSWLQSTMHRFVSEGGVVIDLSEQVRTDNGAAVLGTFLTRELAGGRDVITLYAGSNTATLAEELIHYTQAGIIRGTGARSETGT